MPNSNFIKSNHIYIYASELSNLEGLNKFQKPSKVLLKLWKTNFPQDFKDLKSKLEKKKLTLAPDEKREETFQRIAKKYSDKTQKIEQDLEKCKKEQDVKQMRKIQKEMINHCQDLEAQDKIELERAIYEITNTNFGTKNEKKSIHIYTELTGTRVLKLAKFYKRPLIKSEDNIWFIGGKVDGILDDRTVIEVKNRMRGLFGTVREYEKIQTFAYMFILHSSNSQLVETYLNASKTECGILEVEFDSEYWQRIIQRILKFIHYFNKFMKNEKLKIKLLREGEDKFPIDIF